MLSEQVRANLDLRLYSGTTLRLNFKVITLVVNKCHILYELEKFDQFKEYTIEFLFSYIPKLLENETINGKNWSLVNHKLVMIVKKQEVKATWWKVSFQIIVDEDPFNHL